MESPAPRHVVFFDHACLLCNGTVRFLMARDHRDVLRFAPLQGPTAREMFSRHPEAAQDPEALTSLVLAEEHSHPNERVTMRSTAVARVLRKVGGFWGFLGLLLSVIPRPLRDWGYNIVARHRIRWFGIATPDTCPLPTPEQARKLLP
ncbi:MAG: thiol-disulfide oxidoreductase DCC family protein [Verrucomicrobiales bacterium]